MTLASPTTGSRVRALAASVLRASGHPAVSGDGGRAAGAVLVLPVFAARREDPAGRLPSAPVKVGWRASWLGEDLPDGATLDLQRLAGGRPRARGLSWGGKAAELADALARAAAELGDAPQTYRPAILRFPWLHAEALWLRSRHKAARDRLYDLAGQADEAEILGLVGRRTETGGRPVGRPVVAVEEDGTPPTIAPLAPK